MCIYSIKSNQCFNILIPGMYKTIIWILFISFFIQLQINIFFTFLQLQGRHPDMQNQFALFSYPSFQITDQGITGPYPPQVICCRICSTGHLLQGIRCRIYATGHPLTPICCRIYAAGYLLSNLCRRISNRYSKTTSIMIQWIQASQAVSGFSGQGIDLRICP